MKGQAVSVILTQAALQVSNSSTSPTIKALAGEAADKKINFMHDTLTARRNEPPPSLSPPPLRRGGHQAAGKCLLAYHYICCKCQSPLACHATAQAGEKKDEAVSTDVNPNRF